MRAKENAVQQAQQWALEARAHRATVLEILRYFGLPEHDWEALRLIREKLEGAAPSSSVAPSEKGRVSVPIEPTDDMLVAGMHAMFNSSLRDLEPTHGEMAAAYRAMLAASPTPPLVAAPSETISVRFDVLHAYAATRGLDYNELCRTVRDAIADGSRAAKLAAPSEAVQAMERDAARWRQWRKGEPVTVVFQNPAKPEKSITVIYGPSPEVGYAPALDAAIDAAMSKNTGSGESQEGGSNAEGSKTP